ncbi:hypothetical protein Bca101_067971 [Brassica carinata]
MRTTAVGLGVEAMSLGKKSRVKFVVDAGMRTTAVGLGVEAMSLGLDFCSQDLLCL